MTSTNSAVKQFNFTEAQVAKLIKMQDELNTYIHPEWKAQRFDWDVAINDECQEILGHLGWKWWKDKTYKQGVTEQNKAQIKLELIDILHFVLSEKTEIGCFVEYLTEDFNSAVTVVGRDFYQTIKRLQSDAMHYGITHNVVQGLVILMHCVDMTEQEILETYAQKYVLNKFRQDHGYKDGSYVKEWQFRIPTPADSFGLCTEKLEDNEVLSRIVMTLHDAGADTTDEVALYNALALGYHSRLNT